MYEVENITEEMNTGVDSEWYSVIHNMQSYRVEYRNDRAYAVFDQDMNMTDPETAGEAIKAVIKYLGE